MRARFVAAIVIGLALGAACTGDLFHATDDWSTLCDLDASAPPCTSSVVSSSATMAMPDAGPTAIEMKCHDYCYALYAACPDEFNPNTQKDDVAIDSCAAICTHLPNPAPTDRLTGTNTIDCRRAHAVTAATKDGGPACIGASLAGDGVCGDNCETYCLLMNQPPCDGDLGLVGNPDGGATPTCKELCESWAGADAPYHYAAAALGTSDEFDCHFLHATLAQQPNPPECANAGAASTICVPAPPPDASM